MMIILDGVFNHCSSFNRWTDRDQNLIALPLREAGIPYGMAINRVFCTTDQGFQETDERVGHVDNG